MEAPKILIIGCGIAGPALASFLLLSDIPVAQKPCITILERSSARSAHLNGQNIDIRGAGLTLIRKLGIEQWIRASTTGEEGVHIVDGQNRAWCSMGVDKSGRIQAPTSDIEILRGKLAEICWKNSQRVSAEVEREGGKAIEYIFGDFLDELDQNGNQVNVRFAKSGETRSFDMVVGADGLQSRTRKMVWGIDSDKDRMKRLGMYSGFFSIPRDETDDKWRRWYHTSGRRSVMLRPDHDGTRSTVFMSVLQDDPRLIEAAGKGREALDTQKALLKEYFQDAGWKCDRILKQMEHTEDFYYDMVAQIKMDRWSKGRVVLLGDAGYCASPISGMGTTLAFIGAYNLAGALQQNFRDGLSDPSAAFAQYEQKMRPVVEDAQHLAPGMPRLFHPETWWGVWVMRLITAILSRTRIIFVTIMAFGRLLHLGPQAANTVPVDDYGIKDLAEWTGLET